MGQLIEGSQRLCALVLSDSIELPNRGSIETARAVALMTCLGLPTGACTCHALEQGGVQRLSRCAAAARMLSHEGPSCAAI